MMSMPGLEIIFSSSVLIVILLVMRALLNGRISARLQYALWILVAARLLLPFNIGSTDFSLQNTFEATGVVVQATAPVSESSNNDNTVIATNTVIPGNDVVTDVHTDANLPKKIGAGTWVVGFALVLAWQIRNNVRFHHHLKKHSVPLPEVDSPLPVYLCTGLPSPCLCGLKKPIIYLNRIDLNPDQLHHIITHEYTHYKHGDLWWSVIRMICVSVHWFNPLVWLAAKVSRRDEELACDEGTVRRLGSDQRKAYGETILSFISDERPSSCHLATTMAGDKNIIKVRIKLIAKKPRRMPPLLVVLILMMAIAASGFTFSGGADHTPLIASNDKLVDVLEGEYPQYENVRILQQQALGSGVIALISYNDGGEDYLGYTLFEKSGQEIVVKREVSNSYTRDVFDRVDSAYVTRFNVKTGEGNYQIIFGMVNDQEVKQVAFDYPGMETVYQTPQEGSILHVEKVDQLTEYLPSLMAVYDNGETAYILGDDDSN